MDPIYTLHPLSISN